MNHRIRDRSSRSLMSQYDIQTNNSSTLTNRSSLIRKFSTSSSASLATTSKTETTTISKSEVEKISKEETKSDDKESISNVQLRSTSTKIKSFKNLLSPTKQSTSSITITQDIQSPVKQHIQRPNTLNVITHEQQFLEAKLIICDALVAWRSKARFNIVPAERLKELFHELQFSPSSKQISEILQTAKFFSRKGDRPVNGLTFGEFCVLAADLKRFRSCKFTPSPKTPPSDATESTDDTESTIENDLNDDSESNDVPSALKKENHSPEVFLGGSCNPTTWRADVAIPTLEKLGISFYNPQVSHWTPDLMDLEYRAKEKAQVLFFVMDSETRATAGAIEVAYIAGQNARQLVLVLHSYRADQCINNEAISLQEYNDLSRNQQLLKEMVQRRGIPCLDNISDGLKRTKQILAGVRDPPLSISSVLGIIRGAFDRVVFTTSNSMKTSSKSKSSYQNNVSNNSYNNTKISLEQCQLALSYLGYAQSFLSLVNLKNILLSYREPLIASGIISPTQQYPQQQQQFESDITKTSTQSSTTTVKTKKKFNFFFSNSKNNSCDDICLNFDEFCIVAAHLSLLQQEIYEHGCISPIKGTNITPPPIFLANMQETSNNDIVELRSTSLSNSKRVLRTGSFNIATIAPSFQLSASTPLANIETQNKENSTECKELNTNKRHSSRDSGTSSPQPPLLNESTTQFNLNSNSSVSCNSCASSGYLSNNSSSSIILGKKQSKKRLSGLQKASSSRSSGNFDYNSSTQSCNYDSALDDESDSNDSVFSSGSSVNSYLCDPKTSFSSVFGKDFCDVYLGGSCFLRTTWRYKIAIPYLNSKGITYHLPALHESIIPSQKLRRWLSEISSKSDDEMSSLSYEEKLMLNINNNYNNITNVEKESTWPNVIRKSLYNPSLLDASRVLLFVITNETRSLAPMTLAAHCIGLMYNIVLCVQMLPETDCYIGNEKLTPTAIKDYNRGRSYLIDLAKRQGVPVFDDIQQALDCVVEKLKSSYSRNSLLQNKFSRIL